LTTNKRAAEVMLVCVGGLRAIPIGAVACGISEAQSMGIEDRLWAEVLRGSRCACQPCKDQMKRKHIAQEDGNSLSAEAIRRPTLAHGET
jgi:hypothetical protein